MDISNYKLIDETKNYSFNDVLQFIVFGTAIPIVGILIWNQLNSAGGFSLTDALQNPKFLT